MRVRDVVRKTIIEHFYDKRFKSKEVYEFILATNPDVTYKQIRDAFAGLKGLDNITYFKGENQEGNYFIANESIKIKKQKEKTRIKKVLEKQTQIVYETKYAQLTGEHRLVDAIHGRFINGFDFLSGHITRARPHVYVGCSMGMV